MTNHKKINLLKSRHY